MDLELTYIDGKNFYQLKDGFKFGTDIIELFDFIEIKKNNVNVLEIGSGSGILPILLSDNEKIKNYDAVDIQKENFYILNKNIENNNFKFKINSLCEDIKKLKNSNMYDIIFSNPPFMEIDGKQINENIHKKISRHEVELNLKDFIKNAKRLLKPCATLFFVHRLHRMVEIIKILDEEKFCVSRIRFIKKDNKYLNIVLIEALKGKKSILKVEDKNI